MKGLLKSFVLLLGIIAIYILVTGGRLKDFRELKEAGYQAVEPQKRWLEKSEQNEDGSYYASAEKVSFLVKTPDGDMYITMQLLKAYDTDDLEKAYRYFDNKKTIEGYFYYAAESREVYYSDSIGNKDEFIKYELKDDCIILGIIIFFLTAPSILLLFISPKRIRIPKRYRNEMGSVVCTYRSFIFSMFAIFLLAMGIGMAYSGLFIIEGMEIFERGMFVAAATLPFAGGGLFLLYMCNYVVVFHSEGIYFRNCIGKVYEIRDEDVKSCIVRNGGGKNSYIYIHTRKKLVALNCYCTNYYDAKRAVEKYSHLYK